VPGLQEDKPFSTGQGKLPLFALKLSAIILTLLTLFLMMNWCFAAFATYSAHLIWMLMLLGSF
jgi:hypothetical protein